jgi:hypothetical protein
MEQMVTLLSAAAPAVVAVGQLQPQPTVCPAVLAAYLQVVAVAGGHA